ncbi:hypothetical protein [Thomasclavelia sp.]|uniref:hypothetical protein n=1 Tax=Thomasclavelia sp. TaxID=3025757 RepID=UPI0025F121F7|nr:hypothetical protein [Thomasclavelia sp.]
MKLTDFERRLLKNTGGLKESDIKFLMNYYQEDEMKKLIDVLKRINASDVKNKLKEKEIRKLEKLQQLNFEKQCKCNVGALVIKKIFELNLLENYSQIIEKGTNDLTPECQKIMFRILKAIEDADFK